jgi:Flp pilus assembly protein TadG
MALPRFTRRRDQNELGFARNERGGATIEFVIVFPMLVWAFLGIFLFWDVYRGINTAQKASFIVADALSRTSAPLTTNYIDGLTDLLAYLSNADATRGEGVRLRVTSVKWDIANNRHSVDWSYTKDTTTLKLSDPIPTAISDQIPTLSPFETVIVVETEIDYVPPFLGGNVGGASRFYTLGLGAKTFDEFIVIRPRFIPKVCLQGTPCT